MYKSVFNKHRIKDVYVYKDGKLYLASDCYFKEADGLHKQEKSASGYMYLGDLTAKLRLQKEQIQTITAIKFLSGTAPDKTNDVADYTKENSNPIYAVINGTEIDLYGSISGKFIIIPKYGYQNTGDYNMNPIWQEDFYSCSDFSALKNMDFKLCDSVGKSLGYGNSVLTTLNDYYGMNKGNISEIYSIWEGYTALEDISALSSQKVPDTFKTYNLFADDYNIKDISALSSQSNLTDLIARGMFARCTGITSITALASQSKLKTLDGSYMFSECTGITDFAPIYNQYNITSLIGNGMFYGCTGLKNLNCLDWEHMTEAYCEKMFYGCKNLADISMLSKWASTKIKTTASMFYNCSSIVDVSSLQYLDVSEDTDASNMFYGCSAINGISSLSNQNTSKITSTSYMFYRCNEIPSINVLSSQDMSKNTDMSGMFYGCSGITDLSVINGWDLSSLTNASMIFRRCSGFTTGNEITINAPLLTNISSGFAEISKATALSIDLNIPKAKSLAGLFSRCRSLTVVYNISNQNIPLVTNYNAMFYECTAIKTMSLPFKNMETAISMFEGCRTMETIDTTFITNSASTLTDTEYMFKDCGAIKKFDLVGDFPKLTYAYGMFQDAFDQTWPSTKDDYYVNVALNKTGSTKTLDCSYMFNGTYIPYLDLSSQDMTDISKSTAMFAGSQPRIIKTPKVAPLISIPLNGSYSADGGITTYTDLQTAPLQTELTLV